MKRLALVALAACSSAPARHRAARATAPDVAADAGVAELAPPPPPDAAPPVPWLKGDLHAHARPSGDSSTPVAEVMRWYADRGYDFIALTDHNKVTETDPPPSGGGELGMVDPGREEDRGRGTEGEVAVHTDGLIVLAGVELTYNPGECEEPERPKPDGKCRIHVGLVGVTGRPEGRIEWANRKSRLRVDSYQAAIDEAGRIGGLVSINHPQWSWGMTAELLTELARRGATMVEIANKQFAAWNAGDATHPSMEALWDAALTAGVDLWGVASDDAHDYAADGSGQYPAGGAWVEVQAARDPQAIVDALAAGRFYATTGVLLARVEVVDGALEVEVADDDPGPHAITFVGDGQVLATVDGRSARQPLAAASYVRAVVTRDDGATAWTQPARAGR